MSGLIEGFTKLAKRYRSSGGKFLKFTALELFREYYHEELVSGLAEALSHVKPEDVPEYVRGKKALPIPPIFFNYLRGFEDYLETIEWGELLEMIAEANPFIAAAIMDLKEEGVDYMKRFKQYVVDSIKTLPPQEQPESESEKPEEEQKADDETRRAEIKPKPTKKVTCSKCNGSFFATEEQIANLEECPLCGEPA